jgi:Recombination endonuclease VII
VPRKAKAAPKPKAPPKSSQATRDKARESRLRLIFNTCSEEYEKTLEFQNYVCGVTKKPASTLYLDHDHATGKLRGLISYRINKGLALFDDNPAYLRAAADYLENPPYTLAVGEDVYGVLGRVTKKAKNRKYGPTGTKTPQPRAVFNKDLKENKAS